MNIPDNTTPRKRAAESNKSKLTTGATSPTPTQPLDAPRQSTSATVESPDMTLENILSAVKPTA